jgi:hypothetical protein
MRMDLMAEPRRKYRESLEASLLKESKRSESNDNRYNLKNPEVGSITRTKEKCNYKMAS